MSRRLLCLHIAPLLFLGFRAGAQVMTLQQVVDRAVEQSLSVDNAEQELAAGAAELRQSRLARYPSLAAQGNGGYQFGLNVDPTTNSLKQQSIGFMSYSLDAFATLYQGGRLNNTIARNRASLAAAEATVAARKQDIALQAAQLYLEALLAEEGRRNAETLVAQTTSQLARVDARIAAGRLAPVERFELAATLARQEQSVVTSGNAQALAVLRLAQLLRLPSEQPLQLASAEAFDLDAVTLEEVASAELVEAARARQPALRAAQFNEQAAAYGTELARAGFRPTVSIFGQANTRYSSAARSFIDDGTEVANEQRIVFNGQEQTITFLQRGFSQRRTPFGQQLNDFFGQSVGLQVRIPIFSQGQNTAALARAESFREQASIQRAQAELDFRIEVEQALLNARAARAEVAAARRALAAAQASLEAAERRLELGAGAELDLSDQQLLLEQAQIALLRARYQYVFNAKVVDFYLGRPLAL